MVGTNSLYQEVVKIAEDYFGPAAPRVVHRLVSSHLHKDPETLVKKDIRELTKWTRLAISMLTEDKAVIDEFIGRLRSLSDRQHV